MSEGLGLLIYTLDGAKKIQSQEKAWDTLCNKGSEINKHSKEIWKKTQNFVLLFVKKRKLGKQPIFDATC